MKAKVSEIFFSIQGEGKFIGLKAAFIRLCGCNLNCYFCDTKYAINCTDEFTDEEIHSQILQFKTENVIFTGGEPTLQDEFIAYFIKKHQNYRFLLETNGTIFPQKSIELLEHIVVSPKMFALNTTVLFKIKKRAKSVEFKFVVEENFEEEIELAKKLNLKEITLQPIWFKDTLNSYLEKTRKIIEKAKQYDINVRVIPQLHKILYGNKKGV
ncbi:7-carboxy-7-deazaguanine synthase QueE [Hippea alviniae]|uniref:7-carboxy-7-deazaguanine synthase QueE n=1 Tax=Hippea alviniae TaxID=1279027 RepID=UPI0003B57AB6|nr:7-carboxy-7-deazaguanine synthase QueE [Hippea alviniae]